MFFIVVGVILVVCNLLGWGPMGHWNWSIVDGNGNWGDLWKFVLPFLLALAWWFWSDATGLTKKKEMIKDAERKRERRDRNIDAMGLGHLHRRDGKSPPRR